MPEGFSTGGLMPEASSTGVLEPRQFEFGSGLEAEQGDWACRGFSPDYLSLVLN